MKPRRTPRSTACLGLEGGNEDHDLWVRAAEEDGLYLFESVWELSDAERQAISEGQNVQLTVFGRGHPPVHVAVVDTPLGKDGDKGLAELTKPAIGKCNGCGRLCWEREQVGKTCAMRQFDGNDCTGVFKADVF